MDRTKHGLTQGKPGYSRAVWALVAVGLAGFSMIYSTQGLIPVLQTAFDVPPHIAATTIGATTGTLAVAILPAAIISERFGRGPVMKVGLVGAVLVGLLAPLAPTIEILIVLRALQGLLIAGVPACAMAWLADEMHPLDLPKAMGVYVAGTTVGGLLGRLIPTGLLEFTNWKIALVGNTVAAGILVAIVLIYLPTQRGFTSKKIRVGHEISAIWGHLKNPTMLACFSLAFILMGSFVSLYNYIGIHLIDTWGISPSLAGFIFVLYLCGTLSASLSGRLASWLGKPGALITGILMMIAGFALLLIGSFVTDVLATAIVTTGLFTCHSIASGWVGAAARRHRGEATGTYLAAYYLGSSIIGIGTGVVLDRTSWTTFTITLCGLAGLGLMIALALSKFSKRA